VTRGGDAAPAGSVRHNRHVTARDPTTGATATLAHFAAEVTIADLPPAVVAGARRHMLDTMGLMVGGSATDGCRLTAQLHRDLGGTPQATAIGTGDRVSLLQAAYANGEAAHAMDFDDTQLASRPDRVYGLLMHPSAPILGAVLPVAESRHASGADLLLAYAIGVEASCTVAEALDPTHYRSGFHTTGTCGALGAALGAGRLLGLDARAMAIVLGLAASTSAGLRENFGTMTKPFHAGRAAENGVLTALRVNRGHTASPDILEASRGFFSAYGGGEADVIRAGLARPWTFERPGISIKPYPSGSLTHPAIDAVLELASEHRVRPEDVAAIRVGVNGYMPQALLHDIPVTGLEAKFSLPYAVAVAVLDGAAGLAQFSDERVARHDVQALLRRVEVAVDARAEAAGYHEMYSIVTLHLADGRVLERQSSYARGSPQKPLHNDELHAKVRECVAIVDPRSSAADAVIAEAGRIETVPDVANLAVLRIAPPTR
jgi:2-methylcitrate dehydratase PrpD